MIYIYVLFFLVRQHDVFSGRFFEVFVHVIAVLLYSFIKPKLAFAHLISLIVQDIINDMFLVLMKRNELHYYYYYYYYYRILNAKSLRE